MPNISGESWFPSVVVWKSIFDNIDNDSIVGYTNFLKNKSSGKTVSNYGGWQSDQMFLAPNTPTELKKLFENISECLFKIGKEYSYKKIPCLADYWINVNSFGNFNYPHLHGSSTISGVYYVKANGDGIFRIVRSQEEQWLWRTFTDIKHKDTANYCDYKPVESSALFFPSWVSHMVTPLEQGERISIAFNAF